jgi:hypothetical protein
MEKIKDIETREELYLEIPKGGVGAELGTCKGLNAINLFFITKPSTMFLVDLWSKKTPDGILWPRGDEPSIWYDNHVGLITSMFEEEINNERVVLVKGFSYKFFNDLSDDSLDWVYLDSDHQYDVISRELSLSLKKVKRGGYIMGHDYFNVTGFWGSSVVRAVNERIQSGDIKMEAITLEKWPSYLCRVL